MGRTMFLEDTHNRRARMRRRAHLHRLLQRWARLVGRFAAHGESAARGTSSADYVRLHRALRTACDRCLAMSADPERRRLHHLSDLVQPWVSLEALSHGDGRILRQLRAQCGELEQQLFPEGRLKKWGKWLGYVSAAFLLACAVTGVSARLASVPMGDLLARQMRGVGASVTSLARQHIQPRQLALLTSLAVLVGMWLADSARKS
jgi:hypothetical protein